MPNSLTATIDGTKVTAVLPLGGEWLVEPEGMRPLFVRVFSRRPYPPADGHPDILRFKEAVGLLEAEVIDEDLTPIGDTVN